MKQIQKRFWSLLLAAAMVLTLLPLNTLQASAAGASAAIRLDSGNSFGITGGGTNWVYFGNDSGTSVKWRILSTDKNGDAWKGSDHTDYTGNGMFLLSEALLGNSAFKLDGSGNSYQGSDLQTECGNVYINSFAAGEKAAVLQTIKTDLAGPDFGTSSLIGDSLFPLSAAEAMNSVYGFSSTMNVDSARSLGNTWWLRSPGSNTTDSAIMVDTSGLPDYNAVTDSSGIRPAFNLNLSSVLFTAAAAGGKSSGDAGAGALRAVQSFAPTEWKLTLLDSSRSSFTAFTPGSSAAVVPGSVLPVFYNGAKAGVNEYISAILADSSGNALYYGRIKNVAVTQDESGIQGVSIPSGLAAGSYILKVFSEQYNGDYKTDYASAFQNIPLTVTDTSINQNSAIFDKFSPADISVVKTDGSHTFSGILNGAVPLVQGTDYTVSGDTVTIKKEYLLTLADGPAMLAFNYGMAAANPVLMVLVTNTAPADYAALGDSIATGYGLAGYNPGTTPADAYVSLVGNALGLSTRNLAMDGLISPLFLANLKIPLPPVPSQASISRAKIITLSIGSNDVLGPFMQIIAGKLGCNINEIQTTLAGLQGNPTALAGVLTALNADDGSGLKNNPILQNAASGFSVNFQSIISTLKALTPDAKIYVTNAYNPYEGISLPYVTGTGVSILNLGAIADGYIKTLNSTFDANSKDYTLIDVYSAFSDSLKKGVSPVNANLMSFNFDPHPNTAGHALIADLILANQPAVKAPSVSTGTLTVNKGGAANFDVDLGLGTAAATGASIMVDNSNIASVSTEQITTTGAVTVTGLSSGTTDITVTFNDEAHTTKKVAVTVQADTPAWTSGGSSANAVGTAVTVQPEKKPDYPVTASFEITPAVDKDGHATAAVSEENITDAIAKAQAYVKEQGKTENGIGIAVNVKLPATAKSAGITLPQPALKSLIDAGVKQLEINGVPVSLSFDLKTLKEIQKQSTGDVTVSITPATGLSEDAGDMIGTRPVYNVTLSYLKDGKTVNITNLDNGGDGRITLSIPYMLGKNEAAGYLYGVYVDGKGNAARIAGSAYDVNSRSVIFTTNHFSVYGVGYTAPSAKFTDISTHWAKESIDYVVGRGLLAGTSDTAFSPDAAMTRGMLVTVLGRLAGVDVNAYKTSSFNDVAKDKYYAPYIEWAYKKGIIQGVGNSRFAPGRAVTREEIAVIFANYAKATGYTLPVTREAVAFADSSTIAGAYKDAVKAMQQAGIMTGKNDNRFSPKTSATRAEVSAMLHIYIKLAIDPDTVQG